MKTLLRALLALVAGAGLLETTTAQAQTFPNSSLDSWVMRNNIEAPTNWLVTNDLLPFLLPVPIPGLNANNVTKTAVARTGPFAAQLQTSTLSILGQSTVVPAFLLLGSRVTDTDELPGGLPFTSRPAQMQFAYKLTGPNALNDSAAVIVQLTRTTGGTITVIAQAQKIRLDPAANFTLMSLPLQYASTLQPDTVRMAFISGVSDKITIGTTLTIDDISFTGGTATATRDATVAAAISVAPNPSPNGRYTFHSTEPALLAAPLTVLDATGRVVRREAALTRAVGARSLDLSHLAAGIYTVQLLTSQGPVTKKVSVQ